MSIKIQINSLDALERLIGGDNELEIEIRSSIVDAFTKKHLVKLANSEIVKESERAITATLKDMLYDEIGQGYQIRKTFLKPEIVEKIKSNVIVIANTQLKLLVDESLGLASAKENIDNAINVAVDKIINELSDENLNKRLDLLVRTRLGI